MAQIKLNFPDFLPDFELYLSLVNTYFTQINVNDDNAKYNILICHLPPEILQQIRHVVLTPPNRNRYTFLCTALKQVLSQTSTQRVHTLLHDVAFSPGNVRLLWNDIQRLVPDLPEDIARDMFISKLPIHLKTHAITHINLSILQLVELLNELDQLHASNPTSQTCPQTAPFSKTSEPSSTSLLRQMDAIRQDLSHLSSQLLNSSASETHLQSPAHPGIDKQICYYHKRFSNRARNCIPPCCFNQKN